MSEPQASRPLDSSPAKKRAVVVIHGIGNQSPMATLRRFVEAVWTSCERLARTPPPRTWSKRDAASSNYELRRITTNEDTKGCRTDFFEFYWADQMEDTQFADVIWWLKRLFLRSPARVPPAIRGAWIAGLIAVGLLGAILLVMAGSVLQVLNEAPHSALHAARWLALAIGLSLVLWFLKHVVLIQVVGDAARYLTPSPANIAARSRIRKLGLHLLKALHEKPHDYDRIVFVCHSLGTVIGYDILNFYWGAVNECIHHQGTEMALDAVNATMARLRQSPEDDARLADFRKAQRVYAADVKTRSRGAWRVTDFVTLGSPLTHAALLMVNDREELLPSDQRAIGTGWIHTWRQTLDTTTAAVSRLFFARMAQREFPCCPPLPDQVNAFTYAVSGSGYSVPHHAAVFAPVRWTNIFAPCRFVFQGDVVGGPVRPMFGPGIRDVALTGAVGRMLLAHTHYWDLGQADDTHLDVLRRALNLLDAEDGSEG